MYFYKIGKLLVTLVENKSVKKFQLYYIFTNDNKYQELEHFKVYFKVKRLQILKQSLNGCYFA